MKSKAVGALMVLAAVQSILLGYKLFFEPKPPTRTAAREFIFGTALGDLRSIGDSGEVSYRSVATGRVTVLLAFDTACVWCGRNAPVWSEWTRRRADVRFVGVTTNPVAAARQYAETHQWRLDEVWRLDRADSTGTVRAILGRTPWYFVIDGQGRLVMAGHGAEAAAADSAIAGASSR